MERQVIMEAMEKFHWNQTRAATIWVSLEKSFGAVLNGTE